MKEYPETHQQGIISIESPIPTGITVGDLGVQIATDGRIWLCVNGVAWLRFKPSIKRGVKAKGGTNE